MNSGPADVGGMAHFLLGKATHAPSRYFDLYGNPSPFPPSFEGNPVSYAFGLFGDVVSASLALAILLTLVFEHRRAERVDRDLGAAAYHDRPLPFTPLWLYQKGLISFLSFVVLRALPDAVWMLAWGEVSRGTIEAMLMIDLLCDGFALIPLFFAAMAWAWGRQVIPHKLAEGAQLLVKGRPPWDVVLKNGKIVLAVLVISLLVTLGKASA